ncbi:MAG TPA: N-acetyltransferase [Erysipelotrichaceae bacterium]|nr:N-acetyltransferase [Erysipelotrichaceae bacterium]HAO62217.1 N-acetyltransferase [Erysipelotrichaceae bacterium]
MMIEKMMDSDWKDVARIYTQAIDHGGASVLLECPEFSSWSAKQHPDLRFVMRDEDEIVGWCTLSPFSDRYAYRGVAEVSIYVDSNHQGKGIGKALLSYAIEAGEKAGFWTLYSKTFASNLASIKLQEACGFRLVGIHEKLGHDRFGVFQDIAILERRSHTLFY